MEIKNKRICFIVALNCPYGGNIIPSLKMLANILTKEYNAKIYWVFPKQPEHDWLIDLQKYYEVAFTTSSYHTASLELKRIFNKWNPDLVHTHYEAYDIAVAKAINRKVSMVWHIHDHMTLDADGQSFGILRKIKRSAFLALHYGLYGKRAKLIAVSAEMAAFCGHYQTHLFSFPPKYSNEQLEHVKFPHAKVLINGIDISRLQGLSATSLGSQSDIFTFLSYGGQNMHKRVDYLVKAGIILSNKGNIFRIVITKGKDTEKIIKGIVGESFPEWLKLVEQTNEIIDLLSKASCYVSTSVHETMSTAIAEATIYGIPVIQSDISGTYWNAKNPSTFLFKNGDVLDLVDKMEQVMAMDYDQLLSYCKITQKRNIHKLSLEKWCREIIRYYHQVK